MFEDEVKVEPTEEEIRLAKLEATELELKEIDAKVEELRKYRLTVLSKRDGLVADAPPEKSFSEKYQDLLKARREAKAKLVEEGKDPRSPLDKARASMPRQVKR